MSAPYEPTCPNHGNTIDGNGLKDCPYCDAVRRAYWQGHVDAIQLYKYLMDHYLGANRERIFRIEEM